MFEFFIILLLLSNTLSLAARPSLLNENDEIVTPNPTVLRTTPAVKPPRFLNGVLYVYLNEYFYKIQVCSVQDCFSTGRQHHWS